METKLPSVKLRALEPEDLQLLYTIENDESLWDVSNNCTPISKFALRRYLSMQPRDVFEAGELRLVIEDASSGTTVGLVDLTDISILDARAEVGIAVLRSERGKGYGQAALVALASYAKRKLHLRMLFSQISIENNPLSVSLFKSVGYRQIALFPEWHYYNGTYEDIAIFQKMI